VHLTEGVRPARAMHWPARSPESIDPTDLVLLARPRSPGRTRVGQLSRSPETGADLLANPQLNHRMARMAVSSSEPSSIRMVSAILVRRSSTERSPSEAA
jgi:hypothetical protein